jgi:hypothetical protein
MESSKTRTGWFVFAGLLGLTVLEFWLASAAYGPLPYPVLCGLLAPLTWLAVATQAYPVPVLAGIALFKAALIVYFFMHIAQLWKRTGGHA